MGIDHTRRIVPTFAEVAKLIAPTNTPIWLPAYLEWWSQGVRYDQNADQLNPSTLEARKCLAAFTEAAKHLERALNNPIIEGLLTIAGLDTKRSIPRWKLRQLAATAESARSSPQLISSDGKTKRGQAKPKVPGSFDARTLCAARIVVMWRSFRKEVPGIGNREAAAAAQAYWLASGGKSGGYGDPLNGWFDYFKLVRDNSGSPGLKQLIWECDLKQAQRHNGPPWCLGTYNPLQKAEIRSPVSGK